MKQGRINVAFGKVCELYRVKGLPFSLSANLFTLKKRLEPYVEHYSEQEYNLLTERNALNPDGTTRTDMPPEEVVAINKQLNEMRNTDVKYGEPMKIMLTDALVEKLGITGELIEQMDGVICFETEGAE